jgi:hypothetical protein
VVKYGFDDEKFMKKAGFIVPGAQVLIWNNTLDTPGPSGVGILNSATDLKIDYPYGIT